MFPEVEDIVIDELADILNTFPIARVAFNHILAKEDCQMPDIHTVETRVSFGDLGVPDIIGYNRRGDIVLVLEAKLEAPLTEHQKTDYWFILPKNKTAALVFLAPEYHYQDVFDEVTENLTEIGINITTPTAARHINEGGNFARGTHYLMAITWEQLIATLSRYTSSTNNKAFKDQVKHLKSLTSRS